MQWIQIKLILINLFLYLLGANISFFPTPVPPILLGNWWDQLSWQPCDHLHSPTLHPCHPWFCFGHLSFLKLSDSIYCHFFSWSNFPLCPTEILLTWLTNTSTSLLSSISIPFVTHIYLQCGSPKIIPRSIAAHKKEAPPSPNPTHASQEWRDITCL